MTSNPGSSWVCMLTGFKFCNRVQVICLLILAPTSCSWDRIVPHMSSKESGCASQDPRHRRLGGHLAGTIPAAFDHARSLSFLLVQPTDTPPSHSIYLYHHISDLLCITPSTCPQPISRLVFKLSHATDFEPNTRGKGSINITRRHLIP